jgi:hypothetical protein
VRSRRVWRVGALEPGERSFSGELGAFAFAPEVAKIQLGDARVLVTGVLGPEEDEPRPLREFGAGFLELDGPSGTASSLVRWLVPGGFLVAALACAAWLHRRRRPKPVPEPSLLEHLADLERRTDESRAREAFYELTHLLRRAGDRLRKRDRAALSDQEWLTEARAALDLPTGLVSELGALLERAERVKYAGERPTVWALEETFARARAVLEGLRGGGAGA